MAKVCVALPHHLQLLAHCDSNVYLDMVGEVTQHTILSALEKNYPMLSGTIRDHVTLQRRPRVRFFACGIDISHQPPDKPLPDAIAQGREPFLIIGAIAGG
ncbi:hypothetical protein [Zooshikella sp. RANM57]|uniref:hypothetical protein n=1 Tax=Zooshikella sp. RANM57 TaxID=3425863 RepID=UPI003D6F7BAE